VNRRHLRVVPDPQPPVERASQARPEPLPVAVDIARLLRALPPPIDTDPTVFRRWLTGKADLFDRIATAAADDNLAADARAVASAARQTLATLALPSAPADLAAAPMVAPDFGGDAA
jgi:hypothetical protein